MQRDPHGQDGGRLRLSFCDIQDGAPRPLDELSEADAAVCAGLHQGFRLAAGREPVARGRVGSVAPEGFRDGEDGGATGTQFNTSSFDLSFFALKWLEIPF